MQQGLWFELYNLYGRYYAAARGGVSRGRSESNGDEYAGAKAYEEGEAREGGDLGDEK